MLLLVTGALFAMMMMMMMMIWFITGVYAVRRTSLSRDSEGSESQYCTNSDCLVGIGAIYCRDVQTVLPEVETL